MSQLEDSVLPVTVDINDILFTQTKRKALPLSAQSVCFAHLESKTVGFRTLLSNDVKAYVD